MPHENGQHAVLGHVPRLSDDRLREGNRFCRNIGFEPAEERPDEPGRISRRKQIGGAQENDRHPPEYQQPVLDRKGGPKHAAIKGTGRFVGNANRLLNDGFSGNQVRLYGKVDLELLGPSSHWDPWLPAKS